MWEAKHNVPKAPRDVFTEALEHQCPFTGRDDAWKTEEWLGSEYILIGKPDQVL